MQTVKIIRPRKFDASQLEQRLTDLGFAVEFDDIEDDKGNNLLPMVLACKSDQEVVAQVHQLVEELLGVKVRKCYMALNPNECEKIVIAVGRNQTLLPIVPSDWTVGLMYTDEEEEEGRKWTAKLEALGFACHRNSGSWPVSDGPSLIVNQDDPRAVSLARYFEQLGVSVVEQKNCKRKDSCVLCVNRPLSEQARKLIPELAGLGQELATLIHEVAPNAEFSSNPTDPEELLRQMLGRL